MIKINNKANKEIKTVRFRLCGLRGRVFRVTERMPNYKGYIKRGNNLRSHRPERLK